MFLIQCEKCEFVFSDGMNPKCKKTNTYIYTIKICPITKEKSKD